MREPGTREQGAQERGARDPGAGRCRLLTCGRRSAAPPPRVCVGFSNVLPGVWWLRGHAGLCDGHSGRKPMAGTWRSPWACASDSPGSPSCISVASKME